MTRIFLVASLLSVVAAVGCAPRYDVFTAWTVDGVPAADACQQLVEPGVRFRVQNREVQGGAVIEETFTAPCADGQARLETAALADIFVDLLDGETVVGGTGPLGVTAGAVEGYAGEDVEAPLVADLELERGRLHARLTVVGQRCGDAGVGDFTVSLRRNTGPLGREIVVDNVTVACGADGEAFFEHAPVEVGSSYEVVATTTIGGVEYATSDEGAGEGAVIGGSVTDLVVDLDAVGRP